MGNEKNLRPFGTLTESEQREIRSKAGPLIGGLKCPAEIKI